MLHCIRHKKIHLKLTKLKVLKDLWWQKRLKLVRHRKTQSWHEHELKKVLTGLKNNRCRDPQRYSNHLWQDLICRKHCFLC